MDLLLDTHTFLWFVNDDANLSRHAKSLLEDPQNRPILRIASIWEMAIKFSKGKLSIPEPPIQFIEAELRNNRISVLQITARYLEQLVLLPLHPHHKDPFDRLMIAQAISENHRIVSIDGKFDAYPIQRLW